MTNTTGDGAVGGGSGSGSGGRSERGTGTTQTMTAGEKQGSSTTTTTNGFNAEEVREYLRRGESMHHPESKTDHKPAKEKQAIFSKCCWSAGNYH